MAAEPGTEVPQTRRKTLDEIRREIDDEFAPVVPEPAVEAAPPAGRAVVPPRPRPSVDATPPAGRAVAPRRRPSFEDRDDIPPAPIRRKRRSRRVGYLVAGAIGCIGGQGLLIAYVAVLGHIPSVTGALPIAQRPVLSPPLDGDRKSTGASIATPLVTHPDATQDQTAATPSTAAPAADRDDGGPAPSDGASSASPDRVSDSEKALPQLPPRGPSPPPPSAAPAPHSAARAPHSAAAAPHSAAPARAKVAGPDDWVTSQAQLRAALAEWLRSSKGSGVQVDDPSPEVILGSDGRTAKTRVHDTSGTRYRVYELRWARGPNGWAIVGDGTPSEPGQ